MQVSDQSDAYRAPFVRIEGTRHLATQSWKSQARQYQSAIFQEVSPEICSGTETAVSCYDLFHAAIEIST